MPCGTGPQVNFALDLKESVVRTSSKLVSVNIAFSVLFAAAAAWFMWSSYREAEEAVRLYGRNVDSGAFSFAFAAVYLVPGAVVFALASLWASRQWRLRAAVQWAALLWLGIPLLWVVYEAVRR